MERIDMTNPTSTVCDKQIQHDASGVGHAWRNIDRDDIPADIIEEIEGEIIDGGKDSCGDFVGSNGEHYRWKAPVYTTTHDIVRYNDGQIIGTVNLTADQFSAYESQAQQPEGLIRLGALPHDLYELDAEYQDAHEDTTVYLD
jgi:hypothetical protein